MIDTNTTDIRQYFEKNYEPITFEAFLKLKVGDTVFFAGGAKILTYYPYKVTSARWCDSKAIGVMNAKGEFFKYKQIEFEHTFGKHLDRRYADSAGHNYDGLYVKKGEKINGTKGKCD